LVQSVSAAEPHAVPGASSLLRQAPAPLHVSAFLQSSSAESPHGVPDPSGGFAHPPDPLHTSEVHSMPSGHCVGAVLPALASLEAQAPAPSHVSASVQSLSVELPQEVPAATRHESAASLHTSAHSPPPVHGSPEWLEHVPPLHVSVPLQNSPSLHGALFAGCVQAPAPLQTSSVQPFESVLHPVPAETKQLSLVSLHASAHSLPPLHGSPA
jgi:hypothetical protein